MPNSTAIAKRFEGLINQGDQSAGLIPELQALSELVKIAPNGPLMGRLAEQFKGFSTAGDAFKSIIARIAPKMRVVGSGSSSDKDVDLLLSSLGSLSNTPGANALIYQAFMDKAKIDMRRAEIANSAFNGEITRQEAQTQLSELNKQTIISPELKSMIDGMSAGKSTNIPQDVLSKMTSTERAKFELMTPDQQARALEEVRNR